VTKVKCAQGPSQAFPAANDEVETWDPEQACNREDKKSIIKRKTLRSDKSAPGQAEQYDTNRDLEDRSYPRHLSRAPTRFVLKQLTSLPLRQLSFRCGNAQSGFGP